MVPDHFLVISWSTLRYRVGRSGKTIVICQKQSTQSERYGCSTRAIEPAPSSDEASTDINPAWRYCRKPLDMLTAQLPAGIWAFRRYWPIVAWWICIGECVTAHLSAPFLLCSIEILDVGFIEVVACIDTKARSKSFQPRQHNITTPSMHLSATPSPQHVEIKQ